MKTWTYYLLFHLLIGWSWTQEQVDVSISEPIAIESTVGHFLKQFSRSSLLYDNPATIASIPNLQTQISVGRYPHSISQLAQQNQDGKLVDSQQYDLASGGYERWNFATPIKNIGVIGLDFAFEHYGPFSRMTNAGKAASSFRRSNHAFGLRYALKIVPHLAFGLDAKWLRSKVELAPEVDYVGQLGHGYVYSLGLVQTINPQFQVGFMVRNLSNGLSFQNTEVPDKLQPNVIVSSLYRGEVGNFDLNWSLAHLPQFEHGLQIDLTGQAEYKDLLALRLGYVRWMEGQQQMAHNLTDGKTISTRRLWRMEGLKFGLTWQIFQTQLMINYQPYFQPEPELYQRVTVTHGISMLTFTIQRGWVP